MFRWMHFCLSRVGFFIGRWPLHVFLLNLAVVLPILSYFLVYPISVDTDVRRGFAHKNGRSTQEFQVFGDFYNVSVSELELLLLFVGSKNKSENVQMELTSHLLNEVDRLNDFVKELSVPSKNGILKFSDLETSRGDINFLYHAFKFGWNVQTDNLKNNRSLDSDFDLGFPTTNFYGHNISLEAHFFGVQLHNVSHKIHASSIDSVETIALWYMVDSKNAGQRVLLQKLELQLFEISKSDNFSSAFSFHIYGDEVVNHEMMMGSERTLKLLTVGMFLMIVFMMLALRDLPFKTRILIIAAAISSPFLAILTTFAVLGWLGVQFNSIMSMLAFTVGVFSPSSQLSSFCLSTTIAVMLDYIFEFTVFLPCAVWTGKFNSFMPVKNTANSKKKNGWNTYAKFITSRKGQITCFIVLVMMYLLAFFGINRMEATFEPQKTFPLDSKLQESVHVIDRIFVQYAPLTFIVNHPPNISEASETSQFFALIDKMEQLPETYGPNRTELWLRNYLKYDHQKYLGENAANKSSKDPQNQAYVASYQRVPQFLDEHMLSDKNMVMFHTHKDNSSRSEVVVDSFMFVLICQGKRDWHQRAFFIERIRQLVDQYSQFNVSVFDYDATIYDLIITVQVEMLKAVLITIACMTVVCFIIIPSLKYTGIATLSVLSISYTLLGALGWWELDFDPVTMINVLMAIGFSVDFSAASSTLICMFPLFFISIYVIGCFAKTVICVGTLGTLHGLFIIPVILSWFNNPKKSKKSITNKREKTKQMAEDSSTRASLASAPAASQIDNFLN